MLISAAPIVIPVTTANPPTEAVASDAAKKVPVPKASPSTQNHNPRNTTENHEQTKSSLELSRFIEQQSSQVQARQEQDKNSSEQQSNQQSGESADQQTEQDKADKEQQQARAKAQQAQDQRIIEQLKTVDRQVRAHETAHASAGGSLAGAPQLSFTTGPDGKRYASSGEVSIDTSRAATPQATIDKMGQVRQAALAPANPSSQDLKVAAIASQIGNQAQVELNVERSQQAKADSVAKSDENAEEAKEQEDVKNRKYYFTNPVTARRSSLQLNSKIVASGALDDYTQKPLVSQTA